MIEVLKQMYQLLLTEPHTPAVCDQLEVILRQAIAELESQEPVERDWREAPWGFGEKRLSTVEYSDIVSDGGLDPRNKFDTPPQRTWIGLTDNEAQWLYDNCRTPSNLIDMVEARLKEKNT